MNRQDGSEGRDLPGGDPSPDLPAKPAPEGYGATAEDIARGYCRIPDADTDSRTGIFPARPVLRRDTDGI